MRLHTLKHFRSLVYAEESAPCMETLRARIKAGKIAGGFVDEGGRHYVDMDEFDRKHRVVGTLLERRGRLSGAPDLEGLI